MPRVFVAAGDNPQISIGKGLQTVGREFVYSRIFCENCIVNLYLLRKAYHSDLIESV